MFICYRPALAPCKLEPDPAALAFELGWVSRGSPVYGHKHPTSLEQL